MKSERFNDKRVMVVDRGGLFVSWALRLAREFGDTFYHNPAWKSLSPRSNELLIGHGFDEITMVKNFWDIAHNVDLFVFPAIYDGDLQNELVRQGKRVWGSRKGEELEIYRPETKEEMKRLGMPVGKYWVVKGLAKLREFLKEHPNVHVKRSLTRGDGETFHSPSYDEIVERLDEEKHLLGEAAEDTDYTVEAPIEPALEIGYDGFCIDDQFPSHALNGVEVKDQSYLGVFLPYEDLDEHVRDVNAWLAPTLKAYQYRGFLSTEIRVGPDEQPYLIDVTGRSGSPPEASMQEMIANWAEIMWYGAEGVLVDPQMDKDEDGEDAKYSAQAVIYSDHADDNEQSVKIPDDVRRWVKLFFHRHKKGRDLVPPQHEKFNQIGWVVGTGPTVKDAIKACEEHSEQISGYKLEVRTKSLQDAVEEIEKGEKLGVHFSDEPINA